MHMQQVGQCCCILSMHLHAASPCIHCIEDAGFPLIFWLGMVAQDSFDDTPFVTLLERQGLDEQLRHVLLHAIALSPWGSPAQASASSTGGLQSVDSFLCTCLFLRRRGWLCRADCLIYSPGYVICTATFA